jgi:hypothetical protein
MSCRAMMSTLQPQLSHPVTPLKTPILYCTSVLTTTIPRSVSIVFTTLSVHTIKLHSIYLSFNKNNVFKVHPCSSVCQNSLPFSDWIKYSNAGIVHILLIHSFINRHLGHFYILAILNNAAVKTSIQIFKTAPSVL